jgi:hypothetical protein
VKEDKQTTTATGGSAYVAYEIVTHTLHCTTRVSRRYREFSAVCQALKLELGMQPPKLPGKVGCLSFYLYGWIIHYI